LRARGPDRVRVRRRLRPVADRRGRGLLPRRRHRPPRPQPRRDGDPAVPDRRSRMTRMSAWIPPTLGYILLLGAGGVTAKLALRTISWEQLVLWVPVAYIVFSLIFVIFKGTSFPLGV